MIKIAAAVISTVLVAVVLAANSAETAPTKLPKGINAIPTTNVHNTFQLTKTLFSGSAPETDAAFAELGALGIKTLISVDGTKPNVELAHKHGMRYIHIPHGYDGIDTNAQILLIKAAALSPEPTFVHCHHGLHRGPAAAAVICMGNSGWSPEFAEQWIKTAGTGSNYTGLYQTVRGFHKPTQEQLSTAPSKFPEVAVVSGLVDAMVAIDARWDYFKAYRKAGYQKPKDHPDIAPAHEALILTEGFREAQRINESMRRGKDFLDRLKSSEELVQSLEKSLRREETTSSVLPGTELDRQFDAIGRSCVACHKEYRDRAN